MTTCKTVTNSCIDTLLPTQGRPLILSFFSVVAAYGTLKLRDRRAQWICAAFASATALGAVASLCATSSKLPEQEELPQHPWQLLKQLPTTDDEVYWKKVILHYHLNPDNYPSSCQTTMKEKAEGLLKQAALGKLAPFVGDARKIRDLPFIDPEKEQIPDQSIVLVISNGAAGVIFRYAINEGGTKKAKTALLIEQFGCIFCSGHLVLKAQEEWLKDLLKSKPVEHDAILALALQQPKLTRRDFRDLCDAIGVYDGVDFRAKCQLR